MIPSGSILRMLASVGGAALVALLAGGCGNLFVAKHKVLVDAIAAPGMAVKAGAPAKAAPQSYRLLAKTAVVKQGQGHGQVSIIKACIDAALAGKGMYEPPPNVAPDIFIEVAYGVDTTPRVDASARETFLQLSARENAEKAIERGTGPELWDVRVSVLGVAGRMETAMPLLCAVAADYMGTDTKLETKIEIPQNAPAIGAVRETAIKALESKATAASAGPGESPVGNTTGVGGGPSAAAAANAAVAPVMTK